MVSFLETRGLYAQAEMHLKRVELAARALNECSHFS